MTTESKPLAVGTDNIGEADADVTTEAVEAANDVTAEGMGAADNVTREGDMEACDVTSESIAGEDIVWGDATGLDVELVGDDDVYGGLTVRLAAMAGDEGSELSGCLFTKERDVNALGSVALETDSGARRGVVRRVLAAAVEWCWPASRGGDAFSLPCASCGALGTTVAGSDPEGVDEDERPPCPNVSA